MQCFTVVIVGVASCGKIASCNMALTFVYKLLTIETQLVTIRIQTTDRLAQLVERRTSVREVSGSSPDQTNTQGPKITEENVLPL